MLSLYEQEKYNTVYKFKSWVKNEELQESCEAAFLTLSASPPSSFSLSLHHLHLPGWGIHQYFSSLFTLSITIWRKAANRGRRAETSQADEQCYQCDFRILNPSTEVFNTYQKYGIGNPNVFDISSQLVSWYCSIDVTCCSQWGFILWPHC